MGNLSLYASTWCVMTHRWRVVTRDRDKKSHHNLNYDSHQPLFSRREFHTGMTFWLRIAFTWWLGHFISCYLTVHFMLTKYMFASKLQTLRMHYSFQSTGRPISHRNGWSFRVYMIPLRDFILEWNSCPGSRTGVNSRRGDSRRHNILWWYHANKYRAMRGNRSELAPAPRCHVNTP